MDREKVINGLHCCSHTDGSNCGKCPYDMTNSDCTALMSIDALGLLKEQDARIKELEKTQTAGIWRSRHFTKRHDASYIKAVR